MSDSVTVTIDGVEVTVPKGTLVVDAAKRIANDIPVFCYHPKMKPVGMCRMCLVEIGLPEKDRATGQIVTNPDGTPKINYGRVLQTACTVEVSPGMAVRTATNVVREAREDILEFLLTSHPLDCPICDKGGECPLQNLTMRHGPGQSRFIFEDKYDLAKHVPLGDLIVLDRERCIQCARCTRFQAEIADDPVIAFHDRGRGLEIVTLSEPGFDSYFSGNTTDICPVGALTSVDFRFQARPWELTSVASICPHCPVGCNTTLSTRPERQAGGRNVIKRIMPRQNEWVNEIWICDKGRFVHHYADSGQRLTRPMIRRDGRLQEASWAEALDLVAGRLQMHKNNAAGLSNDRVSNEDLYLFQKLFRQGLSSNNLDLYNARLAGGEAVAQVGLGRGSNLSELGEGDAVLVVASDLHEEAPVWWLRLRQAAQRGVKLVVLNARPTRLDKFARYVVHYPAGQALETVHKLVNLAKVKVEEPEGALEAVAEAITHPVATVQQMLEGDGGEDERSQQLRIAAQTLAEARNLVVFYGGEGLTYDETDVLARMLANLLLVKNGGEGHTGRANNGLVAVWPHNNTQGAWDMGIRPNLGPGYQSLSKAGMDAAAVYEAVANGGLETLYLLGADPIGDGLLAGRGGLKFLIVQELFMTKTAEAADVVLPAQSWAEREGTFTNGERRVQRFYPAIPPVGDSRPDWQILAQVAERVGLGQPAYAAGLVFKELATNVAPYKGMDYRTLARVEKQWPDVGGDDLYYGGTAYENKSGLGQVWPAAAENEPVALFELPDVVEKPAKGLPVITAAALYAPGTLISHSDVITPRMAQPTLLLHAADARRLALENGQPVSVNVNGVSLPLTAHVNGGVPEGLAVVCGVSYRPGSAGVTALQVER
jgi:NADH-quinone oxidoreductase subunit G